MPVYMVGAAETFASKTLKRKIKRHFHSLHFNALVVTSVAISAKSSTGPGQVAQLAEHAAENRGVGSSILPLATSNSSADAPPPKGAVRFSS